MLPPSTPRRRLVAARRLGLAGGLAAMLPPSPPRCRLVAAYIAQHTLHCVDCTASFAQHRLHRIHCTA
eukprot:4614368-Pyramimonas_sp.AAC.1